MVIDYEHQTEKDIEAPAAGWIKRLIDKGRDGLWAAVEWTEKARQYLQNREYRYYSPVFQTTKKERRLAGLLRVALTNAPRMNNIRPIVAKTNDQEGTDMEFLKKLAKLLGLKEDASEAQVDRKAVEAKLKEKPLAKVAEAVGLKEDAKEPEILEAIRAKDKPPEKEKEVIACKEVLDALELKEGSDKSEVVATIHALKQGKGLPERVAALEKEIATDRREALVAKAMAEGKIAPAQKEWAEAYAEKDPKGFEIFIAKAPQVVPVDKANVKKDSPGEEGGLSEEQAKINKLCGVSEEAWKKYNPAPAIQ